MSGFFSTSELQSMGHESILPRCGQCGLFKRCQSPKMAPTGQGKRGILVVAEAPGKNEDAKGVQLIGDSGQELRRHLRACGIDLDRDCWKTNACICRSEGTPTPEQVRACRPNVLNAIRQYKPRVIILLGNTAVDSVIGRLWERAGETTGALTRWLGWQIPSVDWNAWICPTWHPAYLLRSGKEPALSLWFRRHLQAAVELQGRPWEELECPDYIGAVRRIYDTGYAAKMIRGYAERGGVCAFDYETNMLKPDSPDARIVSCSVCWRGRETIAFPWCGQTASAMSEFLLSPKVKKVGSNIKFEQRWTKAKLGHGVRGWLHDCMLAAHVLDNRSGITSVKFQSFVLLGQPPWDASVSSFLQADGNVAGANSKNRIHQIAIEDLLLYNGLDSLMEFLVAKKQKEMLDAVPNTDQVAGRKMVGNVRHQS